MEDDVRGVVYFARALEMMIDALGLSDEDLNAVQRVLFALQDSPKQVVGDWEKCHDVLRGAMADPAKAA
jgi:hypothetical protein